jgi:cytochrome c
MRVLLALAASLFGGAASAQVNPNFTQCAVCHSTTSGKNGLGPSLAKIVGRPKASAKGFAYSPAMKAQKGVWTEAELNAFVANPRAKVPGTRMIYGGMPDPRKRAALIAYLRSAK